jgi:hypothetical protein
MCEPAECPETVNQQESTNHAECNDHDALSLRLRHLNLPTRPPTRRKKKSPPHVAERHRRPGGVFWFHYQLFERGALCQNFGIQAALLAVAGDFP